MKSSIIISNFNVFDIIVPRKVALFMEKKYTTTAVNDTKIRDTTRIEGGMELKMTSPLRDTSGSNPEQTIGIAWATCFNMTLKQILNAKGLDTDSKVSVEVNLMKEGVGYYFEMIATVAIDGMSLEDTDYYADLAHHRCPVSKLISSNPHVHVKSETY